MEPEIGPGLPRVVRDAGEFLGVDPLAVSKVVCDAYAQKVAKVFESDHDHRSGPLCYAHDAFSLILHWRWLQEPALRVDDWVISSGHYGTSRVEWMDVAEIARRAFGVWSDRRELIWASQAWHLLGLQGLTTYDTETERCAAIMRFVAMAFIYREFCAVSREECFERSASGYWVEDGELPPFPMGQLVGTKMDFEPGWEFSLFDVLPDLVERYRKQVAKALAAGFGHEHFLFASLWRTLQPAPFVDADDETDDPGGWLASSAEILNQDNDDDKLGAFSWVTEGCQRHDDDCYP